MNKSKTKLVWDVQVFQKHWFVCVSILSSAERFPFLGFHSERLCLRALSRGKASLESEKG